MAPEMLLQKEFNEKVDVYAFGKEKDLFSLQTKNFIPHSLFISGVVLWELFTLEEPYQGLFETLEDLIDGRFLPIITNNNNNNLRGQSSRDL